MRTVKSACSYQATPFDFLELPTASGSSTSGGEFESVSEVALTGQSRYDSFAAGGFWVDEFVGLGSVKEIDAWANSFDAKYGMAGLGEVRWGMPLELHCPYD